MTFKLAYGVILLPVVLSGCVTPPQSQFAAFSGATGALQSEAADVYAQIEDTLLQNAVLTNHDAKLSQDSFLPRAALNGRFYDLKEFFNVTIANLQVIDAYAKALDQLANEKSADSVDAAARELDGNLKQFALLNPQLSPSEVADVAALTDGLARWLSERERRKGLISTLEGGQRALGVVAGAIHAQTPDLHEFIDTMRRNYLLLVNANLPAFGTWDRYVFDTQVAQKLTLLSRLDGALDAIDRAAQALPKSNQDLLDSVQSSKVSLVELKAFIQQAKAVKGFRSSMLKNQ